MIVSMQTYRTNSFNFIIFIIIAIAFSTFSQVHAFISPKQKKKILVEQRARYESPDAEYLYYNRIKCGVMGSLSLIVGIPATFIGLFAPLPTSDKILLGLGGPCLVSAGCYFLTRCFRSGAGVIINEWGIRTPDYGLIIWEEIDYIDMLLSHSDDALIFILKDGTVITLDCSVLAGCRTHCIKKMLHFKDIVLEQSGYFSNRYKLQEKTYR